MKNFLTIDLILRICKANGITPKFPMIVTFRNTGPGPVPAVDNGVNNCDLILACDDDVRVVGIGRTTPHAHYIEQQRRGIAACNMVESQYCEDMWIFGNHLGYSGLVEVNRRFSLIINRETGQIQYGPDAQVGDNFHGYGPASAGCTTVEGCMSRYPTRGKPVIYQPGPPQSDLAGDGGDWSKFESWIASKDPLTLYSGLWLQHEDLTERKALRIGSQGEGVKALQNALSLPTVDGVFGPGTYFAVRNAQQVNGFPMDAIVTQELAGKLGFIL